MHNSKLDFIFSRPLQRFSESRQSFLDYSSTDPQRSGVASKGVDGLFLSNNQIKLHLISSSLEDLQQVNYEPQVSLEVFNLILALFIFAIKYSSTLWHLNKIYTIAFSFHLLFTSGLILVSLGSFEILHKFQTCFANGIRLKMSPEYYQEATRNINNHSTVFRKQSNDTNNYQEVLFHLPFATKPAGLNVTFFFSMFLLVVSSMPIYAFGVYQYRLKFRKLRQNLSRYVTGNSYR